MTTAMLQIVNEFKTLIGYHSFSFALNGHLVNNKL